MNRKRLRLVVPLAIALLLALGAAGLLRGRYLLRTALDGRRSRVQQDEHTTDYALRAQMMRQQAETKTRGWLSVVSRESVVMQGSRGRLNAQLYAPLREEEQAPWALVLHGGLGTSSTTVLDVACALSLEGYRVLAPDLYAHGGSEGEISSLGLRDAEDVCAWVEWILAQDMNAQIVIWAQEEGAAAALLAAGEGLHGAVKAVAADSAYRSVRERAYQLLEESTQAASVIDGLLLEAAYRIVHGTDIGRGELAARIGQASVPILLMHGTGDEDIPAWHSEDLLDALGGAELFFAEGAAYAMARFAQPDAYYETLLAFYRNALNIAMR